MAIIKQIWLRGAKKRLGGAVTYVMNGQQIVREMAANVKNPRTIAQMNQRVKLANLVNFYRSMRAWAKIGAFSNKPQTWSDYNAFVSANINFTPVYLTKDMAKAGCSVVAPYIISRGVLPRVQTRWDTGLDLFVSDIYIGGDNVTSATTIGEMSERIIANNNGIQNGDQISCVTVIQRTANSGPYVIQRAYELTLDTANTELFNDEKYNWVSVNDEVQPELQSLVHPVEESNMGCAFIISRKQGGKIFTGDAQLAITPTANSFLSLYNSVRQRNLTIASYGLGESNFLDPTTTGGSSNNAALEVQILSINFGDRLVAAGGFLGSAPSSLSTIIVNLSAAADNTKSYSLTLYDQSSEEIESIDAQTSISGSSVTFSTAGAKSENIIDDWNSIRTATLRVDGSAINITFSNNGGQADPGDVTP